MDWRKQKKKQYKKKKMVWNEFRSESMDGCGSEMIYYGYIITI